MKVRTEYNFRRSTETADGAIDISSYDLVGRFTTDGRVTTTGADEQPAFVFAGSATAQGAAIPVLWRSRGGRLALRLYGSGSKGAKLKSDSSGRIVASDTAESAAPASKDFAVALEDFTGTGEYAEVELLS